MSPDALPESSRSVVVVGAGLAGLVCARELQRAGAEVTVIDKGRSVGGRLATRRIGGARLDHGAQFFTVRTPAFQHRVDDWLERGVVHVWSHGFGDGSADRSDTGDGHPRYVATTGMNSLAKDLARDLRVETSTMAFTVKPGADDGPRWRVVIDDGTERLGDAVVLTAPLPQTFSLLVDMIWPGDRGEGDDGAATGDVDRHGVEVDEQLFRTDYEMTIGLLCTIEGTSAVPEPGGVQPTDGIFGFIGDNLRKGVSDEPALTFHATPDWSAARWDDDPDAVLAELIEAAAPWLGQATIVESQLKKWRFATPRSIWPDPCFTTAGGTMVLAGDAFSGPRVEGAHNSGLAAAHALLS